MGKIIQYVSNTKLLRRKRYMCKILESLRNKSANDLLQSYDISMQPPIDLSILLKNIGITTIEMQLKDVEDVEKALQCERGSWLGSTMARGETLAIFYRAGTSETRKRFTIAHELAHCCLHTDDLKNTHIEFRSDEQNKPQRERQADIFAGELLIPEEALKKVYSLLIVPTIPVLSQIFKVSDAVMKARLQYLGMSYNDSE